jgi:hypothetical protein
MALVHGDLNALVFDVARVRGMDVGVNDPELVLVFDGT